MSYLTFNHDHYIGVLFFQNNISYLGSLLAVIDRAAGGEVSLGVGAVLDDAAAGGGLQIHYGTTVGDLLGQAT